MAGVVDEFFNQLPPVARHSMVLVIVGVGLATTYLSFEGRLEAAESTAKDAKAAVELSAKKLETITDKVDKIDTAQQVMTNDIQNIKASEQKNEDRQTRIETKLDELIRNLTRGERNGR